MGTISWIRRSALGMAGALAALPAAAQQDLVMFPADQFGHAQLMLPQSTMQLQNVLGRNPNFERLASYNEKDQVRVMSNPVGRLDLLVERNGQEGVVTCTASIISDRHVLTNNHCAPDPEGRRKFKRAFLLMNFYSEEKEQETRRYEVNIRPVEQNGALDYAIFEVKGNPAAKFGRITINPRDPWPGESLLIIHHPAGLPKHMTRGGCRAVAPHSVRGTDILHRCDTLPGSSGSPIFAFGSGAVIGVHYAGSASPTPGSYNFGKRLKAIATDSKVIAALVREAEERKRRKDLMSAAERERERRAMEAKLRAELEAELQKRLAASEGAMRDKLEAELRAKMEDELRATMKTASLAAASAMGAAARPKPIDETKFGAPVPGPDYRIGEITVPLPAGRWRLITTHQAVTRRGQRRVANHLLADVQDGRIRVLVALSTNLDESRGHWYSREQRACASETRKRDYFFVVNNAEGTDPVTCWRFAKFSWSRYLGDLVDGGIDKQDRFRNRITYFLKDNQSLNFFYGFWVHASVKGRFVRALYAFNRGHFGFENKLMGGGQETMKPLITEVAERIQADLVSALRGKEVDGKRFRAALEKVR